MDRSLYTVAGPRGFSFPSPTSLFFALPCLRQADTNSAIHLSLSLYYTCCQYPPLFWDILRKSKERGAVLSYKDYLEEQKKYIRTKKEALDAKREKQRNPHPPVYDPPPAPTSPLLIALLISLALLPLLLLPLLVTPVTVTPPDEPALWVCSSAEEFAALKKWLEPEILANELPWTLQHTESSEELLYAWRHNLVDLAIVEENLADELYALLALAPLWDKLEGPAWENCFAPLWEPEPFRKTYGWAIPAGGKVSQARHLVTLMRHFAQPFTP